ncbi:OLC1v1018450C1 [Oldenlandia corymbosa var. corymbosa]|uniref:OLC1v1018450C1 n=1 Tax=Oldenlandia corymbosa var. corymbosa TaxID=529605 RepID=A0AAV1EBZ4_OLDCO|nr:OLC1v1018450C1 [Oldenlandia corymbosa var. corymbosa]
MNIIQSILKGAFYIVMASNIIQSIQKLASWAKFKIPFFNGELDPDTHHHPEENPLDLEAGLELQQQQQQKQQAAEEEGRVVLPVSIRPSVRSSPSHSSPIIDINEDFRPQGDGGLLNTVDQNFREQEVGKVIMGFVMALTTVFVSANAPDSLIVKFLVILPSSVGLAAILIGILVRNTTFQRYAHKIEQFGAGCVVFAVYALITSFLPLFLQWLPWCCFLMIILVVGRASISPHKQN